MEHNGDIYSCDHFVEPDFSLGNIAHLSFSEALELPEQRKFGTAKRTGLPRQCLRCPVRWACHGGCPKDRFITTAEGEPGLNYLCPGYYRFFNHATPAMLRMATLIQQGRSAADIVAEGRVDE